MNLPDPVAAMHKVVLQKERLILRMLARGKSMGQVARDLGVSRQRISAIVKRARGRPVE